MPWTEFLPTGDGASIAEPLASFHRARALINAGGQQKAVLALRQILDVPGLETNFYLQAWHFLREMSEPVPKEKEKEVLGVVVEVGMPKGLDLVVAYADHGARYYNFSGAGVVWERPRDSLDEAIDKLLKVGALVAQRIGPWKDARPSAPPKGNARINLLTPSGLHFGHGPMETLSKDPMGGAVLNAAFQLMQKLISMQKD